MASSSKSRGPYEVFLSFRGTDVRNNFVGHLYHALVHNGIRTFRDSEELWKGDNISMLMKAIEESHIAIIIFSENYAFSWWCLEEVAKIMELNEQKILAVRPVFYKIDPKEVRKGRASYAEGLAEHESKHGKDSKEMGRWKKALWDAGNLVGWTLNDDGDESELVQRIVKEISTQLARTPLHVAKHPIGIESRVVKLKAMLNLKSGDDVVMVGLWGHGGVGKTTLAKALYNSMFRQFEGSCFLANVRENSTSYKGLVTLQEILLNDILKPQQRFEVSNVDGGINLIRHRLGRKKVLVILDDVDDRRQLNTLAGECNWFGDGSKIIVTTRDRQLLTRYDIDQDHVYEVEPLVYCEALELLRNHASLRHQILEIKTDLVKSVLNHAKGLPLALEVLGSFLRGRKEDEWESTLDRISIAPNRDINNVLKISYDGLEANEKEIFLHIACFFKGWDSEYVKKVLNGCDFKAVIGLQILIERSLIRIEFGNLQMHDLIQLMGQDIVNQECDDPRRRSRLWLYDDVLDVMSHNMGDCAVKAIVLVPPEQTEIFIGPDAFTKMRRLRLLILRNVHNSFSGPICLPNELRWFQWAGCGSKFPEFPPGPKKLVGLDMCGSNIPAVPNQYKGFQKLKYINFSLCESLVRTPDLSCAPNLEELDLSFCNNLVEAHESIADHDKLQVLNFRQCSELSVFPNELKSKNLRTLVLYGCTKFKRFPDIPHKLEGLTDLDLSCTAIEGLPASIENLISLKDLCAPNCKNLVSLPSSIYKLQCLESLHLGNCKNLIGFPKYEDSDDPCMRTGLSKLLMLSLSGCNLSEVDFLENFSCFPVLKYLFMKENNMTSIPTSMGKLDHLCLLEVSGCRQLLEIPAIPRFLTHLLMGGCESLQKTGDLTLFRDFVHDRLTKADLSPLDEEPPPYRITLPGREMPEWVLPIKEDSVSFMATNDLYDKFIGFALCVALSTDGERQVDAENFELVPRVNGECRPYIPWDVCFVMSSSDVIWLEYFTPSKLWGVVNFGQVDGSYERFSLTMSGKVVKTWGFRILCKPLEDDLKVVLQDNQIIDPSLLYEVGYDLIDLEGKSSLMHEDSSSEADFLEDLQDSQMSTQEHSQVVPKRNHKLILPHALRTKTMLTSNSRGRYENVGVGLQLLLLE